MLMLMLCHTTLHEHRHFLRMSGLYIRRYWTEVPVLDRSFQIYWMFMVLVLLHLQLPLSFSSLTLFTLTLSCEMP
ncbi:hypothetical protein INR49_009648 [Caranx melampygus]|nr:hypothetical protein INR49_009648 [Caranx melampygus]